MELALAYLQRKHASLPRKLWAPHFAHAQSPGFHLLASFLPPPPPPSFLDLFAGDLLLLPLPPTPFLGYLAPLLLLMPPTALALGVFGLRTFLAGLVTPAVARAVAAEAGVNSGFLRSPLGLRGLRFFGFLGTSSFVIVFVFPAPTPAATSSFFPDSGFFFFSSAMLIERSLLVSLLSLFSLCALMRDLLGAAVYIVVISYTIVVTIRCCCS
mmetsp:Transcript_36148/g.89072  ORF Transcript_36148/g.89072 Transcript_36148/m.89072 type:complete len:212 (+) Transcript_36148:601-1236(+)